MLGLFLPTTLAKDGDWVTISGTVTEAKPDFFILDKGSSRVIVEMDDWDLEKEGEAILEGDKVIVQGKVDKDFLEQRKIEASNVYVHGINTYYYADSDDEEDEPFMNGFYYEIDDIPDGLTMEFQGFVEKIEGRTFILNTGIQKIAVDTRSLGFDPLDKKGLIKINIGDRLKVSGTIREKFLSNDELQAKWLVSLKEQPVEMNSGNKGVR
jgi:hypothetical protein